MTEEMTVLDVYRDVHVSNIKEMNTGVALRRNAFIYATLAAMVECPLCSCGDEQLRASLIADIKTLADAEARFLLRFRGCDSSELPGLWYGLRAAYCAYRSGGRACAAHVDAVRALEALSAQCAVFRKFICICETRLASAEQYWEQRMDASDSDEAEHFARKFTEQLQHDISVALIVATLPIPLPTRQ